MKRLLSRAAALFILLAASATSAFGADDELAASATALVDQMAAGDFEAAIEPFDATMRTALPADKLGQVWQGLTVQVGAFQGRGDTRQESVGPYRIVFVTCRFQKAPLDAKVVFDRAGKVTGLFFVPSVPPVRYQPPDYVRADSFTETDITVGEGEWVLPGTLSVPGGHGPFPAVVLVHGSGPHDRDETVGPNKPFRDLAGGLASRGIAVLRYDKRTKVHGAKMADDVDLTVREETVDDALAAVALLRETDGIAPARLFVLGHSLGGMLIPRIGARDPQLAGLIVMAGTSRPLEEVAADQVRYVQSLGLPLSARESEELDKMMAELGRVKGLYAGEEVAADARILGACPAYWLDLKGYSPPESAKDLKQPMLILQGGRDYQVTMKDFDGWRAALSGRDDVEFRLYPELNHLFAAGKGRSTPTEYEKPGHVAQAVIDDVAQWITGR